MHYYNTVECNIMVSWGIIIDNNMCWQWYEGLEFSYTVGENVEWCDHFGKEFGSFL